jgi:excisionase family DNA binding protein
MELLTVREVAQELRVSPMTVRRHITAGRLSAVRVGRSIRIRRDAVERFTEPVAPAASRRHVVTEPRPFTLDDPLWDIVGMIDDDGPTDASVNHDKYLADAYGDLHER